MSVACCHAVWGRSQAPAVLLVSAGECGHLGPHCPPGNWCLAITGSHTLAPATCLACSFVLTTDQLSRFCWLLPLGSSLVCRGRPVAPVATCCDRVAPSQHVLVRTPGPNAILCQFHTCFRELPVQQAKSRTTSARCARPPTMCGTLCAVFSTPSLHQCKMWSLALLPPVARPVAPSAKCACLFPDTPRRVALGARCGCSEWAVSPVLYSTLPSHFAFLRLTVICDRRQIMSTKALESKR